jgi:uncharacterized membrane protein
MGNKAKRSIGETHTRTVFKTVSWRFVATLITMTIVYLFTGEETVTLGVGVSDVMAKIVFYYLHERVWHKVSWGRKRHPLADIPVTRELDPIDREKIEQQLRNLGYMD